MDLFQQGEAWPKHDVASSATPIKGGLSAGSVTTKHQKGSPNGISLVRRIVGITGVVAVSVPSCCRSFIFRSRRDRWTWQTSNSAKIMWPFVAVKIGKKFFPDVSGYAPHESAEPVP